MRRFLFVVGASTLLSGCLGVLGGAPYGAAPTSIDLAAVEASPNPDFDAAKPTPRLRQNSTFGSVPRYDVDKGCKKGVTGDEDPKFCVEQELSAKNKLARQWRSYPTSARAECLAGQSQDSSQSYVEVMTCLEMKDWRAHPESVGGITGHGPKSVTGGGARAVPPGTAD